MRRSVAVETEAKEIDISLLKRLLKYLRPYRKYVLFAVLLTLATSALQPLRPYLTKVAVDTYIASSDWEGLIYISSIILGLLVFTAAIRYGLNYLMQWIGQSVLYDIRIKLFEHIQSQSMSFYDNNPVGRLVTRVTNDVEVLNKMFSSGLVMIVADFLLIFWIIGFMFYTSFELALITLTILPVLIVVSFIFRYKIRGFFRKIRLQVAKINAFLNQFISGISTVKLFSQERNKFEEFDRINAENKDLHLRTIFYFALLFPMIEILNAIVLAMILWYSAGNILGGVMTVGILIAFIQYFEMFFRPVRDLSEKYTTLQSAMASAERIFKLLDTDEKLKDREDAVKLEKFKDKIEFRNLSFRYEPDKPVLENVSFDVKKGETVAIVGATGSGKTTLINLLCRFYDYEEGNIIIDGTDIRSLTQTSIREKLALVMQDVFLFSRRVDLNISLGNDEVYDKKVIDSTKAIGAYDFINNLEKGFETKLTERGQTLSAGQRQLIAFSRAFAAHPELLILDEASSNIDSETEKLIERSLEKLLEGRTSIIIAHRLSTIKRADKIVVLHHGKVREIGSHNELMKKKGIYHKLYQVQFSEQVSDNKPVI